MIEESDIREQATRNTLAANPQIGARASDIADSASKLLAQIARHPGRAAQQTLGLLAELGRIASGRSGLAPGAADRRFADPAWKESHAYRGLLQSWLAWSGALAQQFAFQHAKRCRRLVLAATSPGHLMVPGRLGVLLKMASPRRYKDPDYMRRVAGDLYGGRLRGAPESVREHLRHVRWANDYGYYLQLAAGIGWSSLPWLRLLRQPTLVMAGTDDPIVPLANARILASLIPHARLETLEDGHLFLVTSAERSAQLVERFLL